MWKVSKTAPPKTDHKPSRTIWDELARCGTTDVVAFWLYKSMLLLELSASLRVVWLAVWLAVCKLPNVLLLLQSLRPLLLVLLLPTLTTPPTTSTFTAGTSTCSRLLLFACISCFLSLFPFFRWVHLQEKQLHLLAGASQTSQKMFYLTPKFSRNLGVGGTKIHIHMTFSITLSLSFYPTLLYI